MKDKLLIILLAVCVFSCGKQTENKPDSINIAVPYEVDDLDPHAKTRLSNYSACSNFYEPLIGTDAANKITPRLAKSWENPDAYTWVLHLQSNVRFHNGKGFDSSDVVYTLKRVMSDPNLEVGSYLIDVAEVGAIDALTVRIRTKSPLPIFLNKLNNILIVPGGATTESLKKRVNGTGPYRLQKWVQGEVIRLTRNEDYWGAKPALRSTNYFLNRTPEVAFDDLITGKCQFIQYNSKKMENAIQQLGKYDILREDNYYLKYLSYDVFREETPYCDTRPNPFKNPLVRKAIHRGINRNHLVENLPTYAVPASQPVPPFVFGYNPGIKIPEYHPEEAKRLLAEAGFKTGFGVTLLVRQILQETGALVQQQMGALGIRTNVKIVPDNEFFKALDTQDFTFFLSRVGATVGDASDVLEPQLHSKGSHEGYGVRNYIGYRNLEIDRAIDESSKILKLDDRREALEKIMSTLMEDLPWIPLYIDQDVYALDKTFVWKPRHDSHVFAFEIGLR